MKKKLIEKTIENIEQDRRKAEDSYELLVTLVKQRTDSKNYTPSASELKDLYSPLLDNIENLRKINEQLVKLVGITSKPSSESYDLNEDDIENILDDIEND